MLEGTLAEEGVPCENIGKAYRIEDARGRYIEYAKGSIQNLSLRGLRIVLDCANGAAYSIAPLIFRELGAEVIETAVRPDGLNINDGCGALYPENIGRLVREHRADAGIALDGDADRVIFCDANGEEVNGDRIIGMLALAYQRERKLASDTIVVTGMSNLGLMRAMKQAGINVEVTDVGDRYVIERMRGGSFNVGGEQSGHIIFMDYATTGDGQLTALQFLDVLARSGKKASELASVCPQYPQVLLNVTVSHERGVKDAIMASDALSAAIAEEEGKLSGEGRVLVRPSGTEALIRVMVEAKTEQIALLAAENLVNVIKML